VELNSAALAPRVAHLPRRADVLATVGAPDAAEHGCVRGNVRPSQRQGELDSLEDRYGS